MGRGTIERGTIRVHIDWNDAEDTAILARRAHDLRSALATLGYALPDMEKLLPLHDPLGDSKLREIRKAISFLNREAEWVIALLEVPERNT